MYKRQDYQVPVVRMEECGKEEMVESVRMLNGMWGALDRVSAGERLL